MRKMFLGALALTFGLSVYAQNDDPVIMNINGKNILLSEFEYSFNKNNSDGVLDKKSVKEYVPLYVDFKLKVAAAEDAKIDTLASIQKELAGYKEQMLLPTLVDSAFIEAEARKTYDNTAARFKGEDLLTASHILLLLRQDATPEKVAVAKERIDSLYSVLKATPASELEKKFAELAQQYSDDKGSAQRGGALGQFGKGMMIPDFENAAYAMKVGEVSEPVKTPVGYHIIYMKDRHPFEPYEYHRQAILKFLDSRGIKEASANHYVDSIAKIDNVSRDEEVNKLYQNLIASDSDMKNLAQEYYDGTLMYEISKSFVWDKAQKDVDGLSAFFEANKKNYKWDSPRFSGIIIYGKDAKVVSDAKALLKGVKEADWAKTIVDKLNSDSVKVVRIERGLFKEGDNAIVDSLFFKAKPKTAIKENKNFPVFDIYGVKVKKPRDYNDVRGLVTTDYQNMLEKQWVEDLRKKYKFEVFDAIVDRVNKK